MDQFRALVRGHDLWKRRSLVVARGEKPKTAARISKIDQLKAFADHGDLWAKYVLARYYIHSKKKDYVKQGIDYLISATTIFERPPNSPLSASAPMILTPESAWILMVGRKYTRMAEGATQNGLPLSLLPEVRQQFNLKIKERYRTDVSAYHLIEFHQQHATLLNAFLGLPARDQKAMIAAHRLLGDVCREGKIVHQNLELAHNHLLVAAYLGDQQAKFHFASGHVSGLWDGCDMRGVPKPSNRQIRRWLIRGFSKKNLSATFSLGYALHAGIGIKADARQAARIFNHYFDLKKEDCERQKKGQRFGALRRKVHRLHRRHATPT